MPKIQLIYSKPNCGEILTSLDFWVVSFRKSNIPMENPPFIYFDDFPIRTSARIEGISQPATFDDTGGYMGMDQYLLIPFLVG